MSHGLTREDVRGLVQDAVADALAPLLERQRELEELLDKQRQLVESLRKRDPDPLRTQREPDRTSQALLHTASHEPLRAQPEPSHTNQPPLRAAGYAGGSSAAVDLDFQSLSGDQRRRRIAWTIGLFAFFVVAAAVIGAIISNNR